MTNFTLLTSSTRLRAGFLSGMLTALVLAFTATNIHARNFCGGCSGDDKPTPTPTPTASPSPGSTPTPQPTPSANAHIETRLAGAPLNGATPTGEAEFEREIEGSRKLTVKVEHVNLPDGTRLNVFIDGTKVGEIVLAAGRGELSLSTSHGQTTPPVANGTSVSVTNQAGTTIVSGAFTSSLPKPGATPTPTPTATPAPGEDVRGRVQLSGAPIGGRLPQGHADFRTRAGVSRNFEVEVEGVNLPVGTLLNVLVGDVQVGQITLGQFRSGEIEFESEHGQTVPAVAQGTTVTVVNAATGATVLAGTFGAIANAPNPLDDSNFFVRQQYVDFLARGPEDAGMQFYLNILSGCEPNDDNCNKYTRGALSANFFRSPEFQRKGSFVMFLYMVTIGHRPATVSELNNPVRIDRPHYNEFMADLQAISDPDDRATDALKDALVAAWLQRPEIQARYGSLPNVAFLQRLVENAGVVLPNMVELITALNNGTMTRAQVLRAVVESPQVSARLYKQAFVTMEYFGYLRRDPEPCWDSPDPAGCGYIFHNSRFQLSADPDFLENTIVRGFMESQEYRGRFGNN
ncbi:MAG: hypothetical protein ACJ741_15385 [Pyrinomonadaceae bacterium]